MPLLAVVPIAHAEESPTDSTGDARAPFNSDETQPVLSSDSRWAVSLLAASAGLFLAAAVIGPIVRAEATDAVPAAMSHEEDPAADQH